MKAEAILIALLLTLAISTVSSADRVALVIGNNDYDDAGNLTDLRACRLDAQLIRRTFEAVGFTVILGEDQDRAGMDELLTRFESTILKGGTAVVYFAGHAIEFDGKNYLLGTNAKLQARSRLTEEAMNAETFASAMLLAGAKSSFLLLDCCRNAPTDSDWLTRGGASRKAGLAQIDVDGDIIIGYAAKPGAAALEPAEPGSNSPYATALAKWIPSGIKHGDVFEKVRQEVNETTGGLQRTWENGSFLEPYYFVPGSVHPIAVESVTLPSTQLKDGDVLFYKAIAGYRKPTKGGYGTGGEGAFDLEIDHAKRTLALSGKGEFQSWGGGPSWGFSGEFEAEKQTLPLKPLVSVEGSDVVATFAVDGVLKISFFPVLAKGKAVTFTYTDNIEMHVMSDGAFFFTISKSKWSEPMNLWWKEHPEADSALIDGDAQAWVYVTAK